MDERTYRLELFVVLLVDLAIVGAVTTLMVHVTPWALLGLLALAEPDGYVEISHDETSVSLVDQDVSESELVHAIQEVRGR